MYQQNNQGTWLPYTHPSTQQHSWGNFSTCLHLFLLQMGREEPHGSVTLPVWFWVCPVTTWALVSLSLKWRETPWNSLLPISKTWIHWNQRETTLETGKERTNQNLLKDLPHLSKFSQGVLSHWTSHLLLGVGVDMGCQTPGDNDWI